MLKSEDVIIDLIFDRDRDRGSSGSYNSITNIDLGDVTYSLIKNTYWETSYSDDDDDGMDYYPSSSQKTRVETHSIKILISSDKIRENGLPKKIQVDSINIDDQDYKDIQNKIFKMYPSIDDVDTELKTYFRDSRLNQILKEKT
ncbi:MAG: hypothetical protein SLAVMIC_00758 [uncultured marine phage]|uniref:Uncharacterized protein n=1 Tax=uncultured marine phage TaxID=707152 RepID=A0A8D9C9G5_9VIRU|nr:MAG: hypothetical protein SLAVMIC_00758 [uncultured marine phage]